MCVCIYKRATWESPKGVNNQYLFAELWPSVNGETRHPLNLGKHFLLDKRLDQVQGK